MRWIEWKQHNYVEHGHGLWIIETHDGEFDGDCGLTWQQVNGRPMLEVGYHVCADQQGSRRVAEKIGMQHLEDDHGGSIPIRTVLAPLRHARTRIGRTWWTNRW